MQALPEDPLLSYHADTLVAIRTLYNLDKPGQMEEVVDILDAWVKKQEHFMKKDFSKEYLERVIILLKGSVERAKSQLDKICTLRTALPKFFAICDPLNEMKELEGYFAMTLLPKPTKDYYRVAVLRLAPENHSNRKFFLLFAYSFLINEYMKLHDYSDGLVAICDLRGVRITDFIAQLNLTVFRQWATIAMEGYDTRIKSLHYISTSKAIDMFMKILKSMLSTKIGNRVHVHKTIEEVYEFVPKDLLPEDYGGKEKTLDELYDKTLKVLSSEENKRYLKMMQNACTDEAKRKSAYIFSDHDLGLEGTFRTLNLD